MRTGPPPSAEVAELIEELRRGSDLLKRAVAIERHLSRQEERQKAAKRAEKSRQTMRASVREARVKGRDDYRKKLDRYREKVTTVDEKPRLRVPDKTGPLPASDYDNARKLRLAGSPTGFARFAEGAGLMEDRTGWWGKAFGLVSERIRRMSPELLRHFRRMQFDIAQSNLRALRAVEPFLRKWRELDAARRESLALALANGSQIDIEHYCNQWGMMGEYRAAREALDALYKRAREAGFDVGYRDHYWPRVIKAGMEGKFLDHLAKSPNWSLIEEALLEEMQRRGGRALTHDEKIALINGWLRGRNIGVINVSETPNMKARLIETLKPADMNFFEMPDAAIARYIESVNRAVAWREFFGYANPEVAKLRAEASRLRTKIAELQNERRSEENERGYDAAREAKYEERIKEFSDKLVIADNEIARRVPVGITSDPTDIAQSIGALLDDLRKSGKANLTHNQEVDLRAMIEALYREQGPGRFWSGYRNVEYLSTMGSISSAVTQITDLGMSFYASGLWHAVPAIGRALARKSGLTKEIIGLDDIAHEFKHEGALANAVRTTFKLTLLDYMDRVGKETLINSQLSQVKGLLERARRGDEHAEAKARDILLPIVGDAIEATMRDILAGEMSDNVKFFAYSVLSDYQPISPLEHPEGYLKGGNWRVMYMLKTYTLRQFGVYRREIIDEFRRGNHLAAIRNLIRLAFWLSVMGATADAIKDFIFNRDTDPMDLLVDNLLKLIGLNKWQIYQVKDVENPSVALWKMFGAPNSISEAVFLEMVRPDPRGSRLPGRIPIVGKLFESWLGRQSRNPYYARNLTLDGDELVAEASRLMAVGGGDVAPRKGKEEAAQKVLNRWRETTGLSRYALADAIRFYRAREE